MRLLLNLSRHCHIEVLVIGEFFNLLFGIMLLRLVIIRDSLDPIEYNPGFDDFILPPLSAIT